MYGLVVEGIRYMIIEKFGPDVWHDVFNKASVNYPDFSTHERYSEKLVPSLLTCLAENTGKPIDEIGVLAGRNFIPYITQFGYDQLLKILGRRFSDFIRGLDNLHEYLRFSYPKIKPPSFFCEFEDVQGIVLHYRSRRPGYISYLSGQLKEIAEKFFMIKVDIQILKKEERRGILYCVLRICFDNSDCKDEKKFQDNLQSLNLFLPVDANSFLTMFPFHIVFDKSLNMIHVGQALLRMIPDILGKKISEEFNLVRPYIKFTWEGCKQHINNMFQIQTYHNVKRKSSHDHITVKLNDMTEDKIDIPIDSTSKSNSAGFKIIVAIIAEVGKKKLSTAEAKAGKDTNEGHALRLKGQMVHLRKCEVFMYLPTVDVTTLNEMFDIGLFLNDYSLSDCNRDMIIVNLLQPDTLKELLKTEQEKSRTLSKNLSEIDAARRQAKDLLSQMMPRAVAKQLLLTGKNVQICESFDAATVSFIKVKEFLLVTQGLTPMATVNLLNSMYSTFDAVIEKHGVYKVETIGESYMIVCGVPAKNENHAEYIMDTCLDLLNVMNNFEEPTMKRKVVIKIGAHTGPVVAGMVGNKAPRYCLFGDTVNCASRMESHNNTPQTIMISKDTKTALEKALPGKFEFKERGDIDIKGKGKMEVHECISKKSAARAANEKMKMKEEDNSDGEKHGRFTPMEAFDERMSASSMTRMSVRNSATSGRGSHSTLTRTSSAASNCSSPDGSPRHSPDMKRKIKQEAKEKQKRKMLEEAVMHDEEGAITRPQAGMGVIKSGGVGGGGAPQAPMYNNYQTMQVQENKENNAEEECQPENSKGFGSRQSSLTEVTDLTSNGFQNGNSLPPVENGEIEY